MFSPLKMAWQGIGETCRKSVSSVAYLLFRASDSYLYFATGCSYVVRGPLAM